MGNEQGKQQNVKNVNKHTSNDFAKLQLQFNDNPMINQNFLNEQIAQISDQFGFCKLTKEYLIGRSEKQKQQFLHEFYQETQDNVQNLKIAFKMIIGFQNQRQLIHYQKLRNWLIESEQEMQHAFYAAGGLSMILNMLEFSEIQSRKSKSYSNQIELLKIIQFIIQDQKGIESLAKEEKGFNFLIDNLNFVHVGLTSLVFDIINECLIYNIDVKLVLNGLNSFKDRMGHKHRFKAIFIILEESDNAVLVFNTLQFLLNLILMDNSKKNIFCKAEMEDCDIDAVLQKLSDKIDNFQINDTSYEQVMQKLSQNRLNPDIKSDQFPLIEESNDVDLYMEMSQNRQKISKSVLKNFKQQSDMLKQLDQMNENDQKTDVDQRYYLEISNTIAFDEKIEKIKLQIQAFKDFQIEEYQDIGYLYIKMNFFFYQTFHQFGRIHAFQKRVEYMHF